MIVSWKRKLYTCIALTALPCLNFMNNVDGEKAFNAVFKEKYRPLIRSVHHYSNYTAEGKKIQFHNTVIIMQNNCVLEFDDRLLRNFARWKTGGFVQELTALVKVSSKKSKADSHWR